MIFLMGRYCNTSMYGWDFRSISCSSCLCVSTLSLVWHVSPRKTMIMTLHRFLTAILYVRSLFFSHLQKGREGRQSKANLSMGITWLHKHIWYCGSSAKAVQVFDMFGSSSVSDEVPALIHGIGAAQFLGIHESCHSGIAITRLLVNNYHSRYSSAFLLSVKSLAIMFFNQRSGYINAESKGIDIGEIFWREGKKACWNLWHEL